MSHWTFREMPQAKYTQLHFKRQQQKYHSLICAEIPLTLVTWAIPVDLFPLPCGFKLHPFIGKCLRGFASRQSCHDCISPHPRVLPYGKKNFNLQLMLYSTFSIWGCRERRLDLCISVQLGPTTPSQSFKEKESCPFSTDKSHSYHQDLGSNVLNKRSSL